MTLNDPKIAEMIAAATVAQGAQAAPAQSAGTRWFVDAQGKLLGGFANGAEPSSSAIEVDAAPPNGGATWNGKEWVNATSGANTLPREAFCVALIDAGILTEAEAVEAALGAWPPKFEPALQGKPLVEQLTIKNLWRETKTVAQDAPLFQDLLSFYAGAMKLKPAQAEALANTIFAGAVDAG